VDPCANGLVETAGNQALRSTWQPVDVAAVLDDGTDLATPTLGFRNDGFALLYPGKVHSLAGESETGKSWLALTWAAQQLVLGRDVVYVDFEDDAASVIQRLRVLSVPIDVIFRRFRYVRPEHGPAPDEATALLAGVPRLSLVVIDGVTELMMLQGLRTTDDTHVAEMLALPKSIAARGPAVLLLDHVVKDRQQRGRYATGSQHKLAGVTGASYLLDSDEAFAIGKSGSSILCVGKDRPGAVRGKAHKLKDGRDVIARFVVTAGTEEPSFHLAPYDHVERHAWSPTVLMGRVSQALSASSEPLTYTQLKVRVGGKATYVRQAVDQLIELGHVAVERGGTSHLHRLVRPYPPLESPAPTISETIPDSQ